MTDKQRESFLPEKISQELRAKIFERVEKIKKEIDYDFEFLETPDSFIIKRKDENGKEKEIYFTKVNSALLIKSKDGLLTPYPLEDVIEAYLRFPDDDFSEALKKLKKKKSAEK